MIIHGHGQAAAAAQTASLENLAAISGRHTLAKTMDPQAAVNMGLIRSFGRHARSLSLVNSAFSHHAGETKHRCRPFVSLTPELTMLASIHRQTNEDYTLTHPDRQTIR